MGTHYHLVLTTIALAILGHVATGAHISWRTPYWINDNGGLTLEVHGSGFSADQFNQFNDTKGNKVSLVNDVDRIDCHVINYFTTTTKIVCTVGVRTNTAGPPVYQIEVISDGIKATGTQHVQFAWWLAPKVQTVTPFFDRPGTVLKYWGWFHSNQFDKLDVTDPDSSPTSSRRITKVFMGSVECEMYDEDDDLYGEITSHQLFCRPLTTFIGAMNSSVYVTTRGPSLTDKWGLYVDSKDKLYQYHNYPVVFNVTPSVSSNNGGAIISVKGMGFNAQTKVEIGGAECEIKDISYNKLTCISPSQDSTSAGSGSMGVLYELWKGVSFSNLNDEESWSELDTSHPNYTSFVTYDMQHEMDISQDSVGKVKGYLHVGHDGLYAFEPQIGNYHVLHLATDGNASNTRYYTYAEKFMMKKDIPAYFEIRFRSYDHFRFWLGLQDYNAKYTYAQARLGVDEKQRVSINPREVFETLSVTVNGDGGLVKLYINGFSSETLNITNVDEVHDGLMDLTEQKCMLNGDDPDFNQQTSFEDGEEGLPGGRGWDSQEVDSFCGRRVRKMHKSDPRLYYKDDKGTMDANQYRYMCFALLGNTQDDMRVRYYWHDGRRDRYDEITFKHGQTYTSDRWTYHCYDLVQIATDSWISNYWGQNGQILEVFRVYVPKPKGIYDRVYVDEFTFSSEVISVVQTRPSALKSSGGIRVSEIEIDEFSSNENTTSYEIKFHTANCLSGFPLLGIYTTTPDASWPGSLADAASNTYDLGDGGNVTVMRKAVATGRMGGTWDLYIEDRVLTDIDPYVSEERLEVMLDTLMGTFGSFDVSESHRCGVNYWYIKWLRNPGTKDLVTADISKITFDGESVSNDTKHEVWGRVYHHPITPDFLTAYTYTPKVTVSVNSYMAACEGNCEFGYDDTGAPSLTSVSATPDSSGIYSVTVSGTGFTATHVTEYTVKFDDKMCSVTSVTVTQVMCTIELSANVYSVSVSMQPIGSAVNTLSYDVPLTASTINPITGGVGGGYQVTVSGTGFAGTSDMTSDDQVTIGGNECTVITSDYDKLTCIVPPGPAGSADVVVQFGGKTSTLSGAFTYDASLSATISSVTPTSLSVIGAQTITIAGSNLGSSGSVKFGDVDCDVTDWSATSITCTSPSLPPATYPVMVATSQGYASGSVSVTYIFSVTSSSPVQGSTKGGSFITINGNGFGSDCSLLNVRLGEHDKCDITQCTDTSLTCQVQLTPKTHVVTNNGNDSAVGVSWNPAFLNILEGDSVAWYWQPKFPSSELTHNIYQTSTPTVDNYDGSGFYSGSPTSTGSFQVTFHNKGVIYYAGEAINEAVTLRGQINVMSPQQMVYKVTLLLNGHEASYDPDGSSGTVTVDGCSPLVTSTLDSCNITAPSQPDNTSLYYVSSICLTPQLTNIVAGATENIPGLKGIQVRSGTNLTLSGSGFGAISCQNLVTVGDASCTVTSASGDQLTCDLNDVNNQISVKSMPVKIVVLNRGEAQVDIADYMSSGQVTIVPVVTSFTPRQGSIHGGTTITITGTGLKGISGTATVSLGGTLCDVQSVTPTNIICITKPRDESLVNVAVVVGQVSAIMDVSDNTYNYSVSVTPSVSSTTSSGSSITITGSNFGSNSSQITVTFTPTTTTRRASQTKKTSEKILKEHDTETETDIEVDIEEENQDDEIYEISEEDKIYIEEMGMSEPVMMNRHKIQTKKIKHEQLFHEGSKFWSTFTNSDARSFDDTMELGLWRIAGSGANAQDRRRSCAETKRLRKVEEREIRTPEDPAIYTCTPTSVTDTEIICTASELSAGTFVVNVNIAGSGNSNSDSFTANPEITSVDPAQGSVNGGALITIEGAAFDPSDLSVSVGDVDCAVQDASTTSITCLTGAHDSGEVMVKVTTGGIEVTSPVNYTYSDAMTPNLTSVSSAVVTAGMTLTLSGSNLMPSGVTEVIINGVTCPQTTSGSSTSQTCTTPDLMAGEYSVLVRDSEYGDSNTLSITYSLTITSISPATSGFGGAQVTIEGTGFDPDGNSAVTICDNPCNIVSSSSSEVQCVAPLVSTAGVCDITLTNPDGNNVTLASGFTYDASLTSTITSISPARGGTAGGTTITVTGSGFADTGNAVEIGGSECVIQSESSGTITCVTEAHQGPGYFPVLVSVPSKGLAAVGDSGTFFYIDRWSSIYTWGGDEPPSTGQMVVIEEGQTILIDESTDVLRLLLIKGGHVIFDEDAASELILRAEYILIIDGGSLSIGSEEKPYEGDAVIELHGNTKSIELPHYGAKVLAVREGSLDLHGAHIPITWTHLASTASAGDTTITLKLPVTWKAGDRIVIATTEFRFMKNENEVREIASVSADMRTLTLTEALEYSHISIEQTIGGRTIETRAEVGLLSRNVKIRGNINQDFSGTIEGCDEEWNPGQFQTQSCFNGRFGDEEASDQFGATVMLSGVRKNENLVEGRIEYVEVTEAGQAFQLGRYPLHFHLVGNVNTSYIRGCAVHRTYNRAVTIHAADYLLIERNVVYNNMGHAIFTEDGIEQYNTIQYNLAVYTRTSSSLLNVDITPSSYWVVNPNNIVQHNAAAGGTHFGYWYRIERHPSGPSATNEYCQNNEQMGTFFNNTAHSHGRYGLWVFSMDGYFPKSGTCSGSAEVAVWNDFTVWYCERGAEVVFGGNMQFNNMVVLDNERAGLEMVKVTGGFGADDGPGIFNSLIIGYSALSPGGCRDQTSGIIAPKQDIFSIADTKFVNFDAGTCSALAGCSQCKPRQGGFRTQVKGLSFENSPNKIRFRWEHETFWIDTDGSLSGAAENYVVPSMGILPPGDCAESDAFSVNPSTRGAVCSNLKFLRFIIKGPNVEPKSLQGKDLIVSNSHGNTSVPYFIKRLSSEGWMGLLYTGDTYKYQFENSEQITNISYSAATYFVEDGDYYYVQHTFLQQPDGFGTVDDERNSSTSIPDPNNGGVHGDYYWDNTTNTMTYLVTRDRTARSSRTLFDDRGVGDKRKIEFRVYRCKYVNCIPPTVPPVPTGRPDSIYRWSDTETWKDVPVCSGGHPNETTYGLPIEGDDIIIPVGMWLVVDIETPSLGRVYVYGTIEFEDTMDHVFNTTIIFIQGGTLAAGLSESEPFTNNLNIVLRGSLDPTDPDNTDMPMPIGTPSVGWKAIGVFGNLKLHGEQPVKTWVKLGATASAGDSSLTLAEAIDDSWVNKEIMITTTSKETLETEVRKVTAVSGTSLTLDSALSFEHIAVTHTLSGLANDVTMAAEVGLLTRQIVIEGNIYPNFENTFGGRVLVSKLTQDGLEYKGSAQLSGVEFRNMGQLGFDDSDDPRFSLTFHSIGTNTDENYVTKCSFNTNYNTALGFFDAGNITVDDSIIYHTVGGSIVDESEGNIYKRNLVSTMLFPGKYNGAEEEQNLDYYGAFHLTKATNPTLDGNTVAGSQQAGIMTYGEDCDTDTLWTHNELHSSIFGVLLWKKSGTGTGGCRRINNFYAWRIEDTAFYMQIYESLEISNVISVDNKVGTHQLVYQPASLSHVYEAKTATVKDSIFVGATPSHTCEFHQSSSIVSNFLGQDKFWQGAPEGGNTAIVFASFMSGVNMAPKHSFHEAASYPALGGGFYVKDVTFSSFNTRSSCAKDIAMSTNNMADDAIHPIFTSGLTFLNTPQDNMVHIHRPNLGKVNPSDCVDMACDGHKKLVLEDMDGSLLNSAGATLTSEAEYEWDGEDSYGVGDYRIPVPLRQNANGSQILEGDKFPNKGIVRDNSCVKMTAWQGWKCTGLTHRMFIIESMDSDTEIRRLSPIALIANPGTNGYVDLLNGPMDRGWCFGYTCQERISTFYSVVAANYQYEMAMTSTPPQHIRLRLLHSDASDSVVVRMFFPKTQRFNVYKSGTYVEPTNIDKSASGYQLYPEDPSYVPTLTNASGTNYYERSEKLLHIVIKGGDEIDIKMTPMIILSTGLAVDPDTFFEENVVENLAALLDVSEENIRVVNVIREDSTRRLQRATESVTIENLADLLDVSEENIRVVNVIREDSTRRLQRATESVTIESEIGSPPTNALNGSSSSTGGDLLTREDLNHSLANLVNNFQAGAASNLTINSVQAEEPLPPPKEPGPPATPEEGAGTEGELYSDKQQQEEEAALNTSLTGTSFDQPSAATIRQSVGRRVVTYKLFDPYPSISVEDANGNIIENLGHSSDPWQFTASLINGPSNGQLLGTETVQYTDGRANFTQLFVDTPGRGYKLSFEVTYPNISTPIIVDMTRGFSAAGIRVDQSMELHLPESIVTGQSFSLDMQLYDRNTKNPIDDVALMGQEMSINLSLMSRNGAELQGNTVVSASGSDMSNVTIDGLSVDKDGGLYYVKAATIVNPAGWIINTRSNGFRVNVNESKIIDIRVTAKLKGWKSLMLLNQDVFIANLYNTFVNDVGIITWHDTITLNVNKKKAYIQGTGSIADVKEAHQVLCGLVRDGLRVEYSNSNDKTFLIKWTKFTPPVNKKRPNRKCRYGR